MESYLVKKAGNDTYTYETEIVVDNGRKLGLVLYGTKSQYFYLIDKIEVYDGEELIQTGLVEDAVIAEWGEGGSYYTESTREDGGIGVTDIYKALIKKTYDLIDGEWKLTGEEGLEPMKG